MVAEQSDTFARNSYAPLFQLSSDETRYREVPVAGFRSEKIGNHEFLIVSAEALSALTEQAFADVSHLFRPTHLRGLRDILDDEKASANDRMVALELLKNAVISSARNFPSCQDTGTAIVTGQKGQFVLVDGNMHEAISKGIAATWKSRNLRFSQMAPLSTFEEANTGTNLPAQIDIEAVAGEEMHLLFIAKGGGSANKTFLFQETRRVLEPDRLLDFLDEKVKIIGTTACPPYHLSIVVGGLSAEQTLKTVKLASTKALDGLPASGSPKGRTFRDLEMEDKILTRTQQFGIGAQFGGKYFSHDVRFVRLPRHGGSLPIGIGVSCSADRQIKAKINSEGVWLEELESDPTRYLPSIEMEEDKAAHIDLDQSMASICDALGALSVATPVKMSGTMIVARDLVHAELSKRIAGGGDLPDYMKQHPVYYAGPAKTPEGYASGSFGPTSSIRMDPYVKEFQKLGGSRIMIGKGNRSQEVINSCREHGGFYLGSIGGTAATLGHDVIKSVETIDFGELGMEAVWRIRVQEFPAFLITNNKGEDFFAQKL